MMETLFVVAQHSRSIKSHSPSRYGSFDSPPSKGFRDINCRSFQSGHGILPTPQNSYSSVPSPKDLKTSKCSNPMDIPVKSGRVGSPKEDRFDRFSYSELWAGPAYSNSPPPSSLPMPKFFTIHHPKRTVSLELPLSPSSEIDFDPISEKAKSAPSSPTRAYHDSSVNDLFDVADTATKTLRRILNLDISDE
ncbi:uncharacterized protein LOC124940455 [Impatiens glandulifera]|uniref:uncharacterized protein LOC124940455 n=1 Tax=Impatiens glandulifera TaxID=253017 RepID=UPI001FB0A36F|nr:uncharacterized protein LOC124940455 [Impatiens glandulifera]XP_047336931.1 uncharacterized protein LOC124940455 [Impatiens glandulifera]